MCVCALVCVCLCVCWVCLGPFVSEGEWDGVGEHALANASRLLSHFEVQGSTFDEIGFDEIGFAMPGEGCCVRAAQVIRSLRPWRTQPGAFAQWHARQSQRMELTLAVCPEFVRPPARQLASPPA